MHRGYIKLWRNEIDSEHQDDLITKAIWYEIRLRVTHQPLKYQGATIPRGGMVTTYKELGEFAGGYGRGNKTVTSNQAQRSVKKLENSGRVTTRKLRNKLLVEVLNYDVYQGSTESEKELGHMTKATRTNNGSNSDTTPIEQEHKNIRTKERPSKEKKNIKKEKETKEPVIEIILNDGSYHPIYQEEVDRWSELYPAVDVMQDLRAIAGWNEANATRRKTKRGIDRHINSWLGRTQNKGGNRSGQSGQHNRAVSNQDAGGNTAGSNRESKINYGTVL